MRPLAASDTREIGRYRLLAELGRGGMGRVLLASGLDGRLVALKQVLTPLTHDEGFRARFRLEVTASRKVSGAYTAAVVDADPEATTPWLASVFTPGPTLQHAIEVAGPLPPEAALRLAAGLATALTEIHGAGLIHRDLKPSNVLLAGDGPRVIDFGIVRVLDPASGGLTRTGWLIGTPEYMSPEQADGHALTPASDVFSLAAVIAAACSGRSPFAGASLQRGLANVINGKADLSSIPWPVRRIIQPCFATDPAKRPTPAGLLEMIGHVAPSLQPWPAPVHHLIQAQRDEVIQLLDESPDRQLAPTRIGSPFAPDDIDLPIGQARSFQVVTPGFDNRYLRHQGSLARTDPVEPGSDTLLKEDATFVIRRGLADDNCYSFESRNYPGAYLRHSYFRLRLDARDGTALFDADATFHAQPGRLGTENVSLAPYNFPDHLIRHYYAEVWIASTGQPHTIHTPANYDADVTWHVTPPWAP
ncbi:AbfB domain-containing protein [Amycolatopsis coloradensis]|uniref:AbfB domain-containing protein n=1 Tax=Amycolatopsis coloradensis TaxID=76021 RepID=A0ACD5BP46_9PSEU